MTKAIKAKQTAVKTLLAKGLPIREVSADSGIPKSTVGNTARRLGITRADNNRAGRSKVLEPRDKRRFIREIKSGAISTSVEAAQFCGRELDLAVSD